MVSRDAPTGQVLTSSTFGHLKGLSDVGLKQLCHGTCQTMLEGLCGEAWVLLQGTGYHRLKDI